MLKFLCKYWSMYDNAPEPWRGIWAMAMIWPLFIMFYFEDIPVVIRFPIASFFGLVLLSKVFYAVVKENIKTRNKINKVWREIKSEKGLNLGRDMVKFEEAIKIPSNGIKIDTKTAYREQV